MDYFSAVVGALRFFGSVASKEAQVSDSQEKAQETSATADSAPVSQTDKSALAIGTFLQLLQSLSGDTAQVQPSPLNPTTVGSGLSPLANPLALAVRFLVSSPELLAACAEHCKLCKYIQSQVNNGESPGTRSLVDLVA